MKQLVNERAVSCAGTWLASAGAATRLQVIGQQGTERWGLPVPEGTEIVQHDHSGVLLATPTGVIAATDPRLGHTWRYRTDAPPAVARGVDGTVYVAAAGAISVLDGATGARRAHHRLPSGSRVIWHEDCGTGTTPCQVGVNETWVSALTVDEHGTAYFVGRHGSVEIGMVSRCVPILILLTALAIVGGCRQKLAGQWSCEAVRSLVPGMPAADVKAVLGDPAIVQEVGSGEQWLYYYPKTPVAFVVARDVFKVHFKGGRLTWLLADRERVDDDFPMVTFKRGRFSAADEDVAFEGPLFQEMFPCRNQPAATAPQARVPLA